MTHSTRTKKQIEEELEKVEKEIRRVQTNRLLRIGVLGVPNSCKTSLFASWYLFRTRNNDGMNLAFDEESLVYLKRISNSILDEGKTGATADFEPTKIVFDLKRNGEIWNVEMMDFSGASVEPIGKKDGDETERKFAEETREFIKKCDVLLCLVRWDEKTLKTMDAIDTCLRGILLDIVLVITKYDEVKIASSDRDLRLHEKDLLKLEAINPVLAQVRAHIRSFSKQSDLPFVIPVSPLGGNFAKTGSEPNRTYPLSIHDLKPFNIYAPIICAIKIKQEVLRQLQEKESTLAQERRDIEFESNRQAAELVVEKERKRNRADQTAAFIIEKSIAYAEMLSEDPSQFEVETFRKNLKDLKQVEDFAKGRSNLPLLKNAERIRQNLLQIKENGDRQVKIDELSKCLDEIKSDIVYYKEHYKTWLTTPTKPWIRHIDSIKQQLAALDCVRLVEDCQDLKGIIYTCKFIMYSVGAVFLILLPIAILVISKAASLF